MECLLPISYLGPVAYYSAILQSEEIFIETKEHFIKQSCRNRCTIMGANGTQTLTIPKERKSSDKTLISDISISNQDNWQKSHWQSIVSAYNSSPFFEYYKDELLPFYNTKHSTLFDFNLKLSKTILELMQVEKKLNFTSKFQKECNGLDLRSSKFILKNQEEYQQVFCEKYSFIPNLSILDVLFNLGPETTSYLERQSI
ncbi:MAG: hypothetical protein HOL56_05995 [Flavobacteriales bacterium]|nr:hypothetical protein [Flavobacteriales bacterium]MBT4737878.1 hypothetical protein [Flavobacteriales bacterium]MBT5354632.1 hypothetical protein [Flavobacteriales bacterium]MBT6699810.1 hypothetical protein [Flavobacteriales bacterium]